MQSEECCVDYGSALDKAHGILLDYYIQYGDGFQPRTLDLAYEGIKILHAYPDGSTAELVPQKGVGKAKFEHSLREFVSLYRAKADAASLGPTCIFLLFDFLFSATKREGLDPRFPLLMVEETASCVSLNEVHHIVAYLADRILHIAPQIFSTRGSDPAFNRVCKVLHSRCLKLNHFNLINEINIMETLFHLLPNGRAFNLFSFPAEMYLSSITNLEGLAPDNQGIFSFLLKIHTFIAAPSLLAEETTFEEFQKTVDWSLDSFVIDTQSFQIRPCAFGKGDPPISIQIASPLNGLCYVSKRSLSFFQAFKPTLQKIVLLQFSILFQFVFNYMNECCNTAAISNPLDQIAWKDQQVQWMNDQSRRIFTLLRHGPYALNDFSCHLFVPFKLESMGNDGQSSHLESPSEDSFKEHLKPYTPSLPHAANVTLNSINSQDINPTFKADLLKRQKPSLHKFLSDKLRRVEKKSENPQVTAWKTVREVSKNLIEFVEKCSKLDIMALKAAMQTLNDPSDPPTSNM
ncbi:hypothetical protein DSO57_1026371 [Entomophthora muscae]|uniref:Uncharacterized protein n=2 Tax=Entomophthora muscae TaxID=34485 RepID=A0ACC2T2D5_9FUNG|nr:hypothetical protein DSO57_1026371 [Entomophthora muscae]